MDAALRDRDQRGAIKLEERQNENRLGFLDHDRDFARGANRVEVEPDMRIELHYHTGGHGGPYYGSATAIDRAVALLKGSPTERTIDLRDGVGGPVLASVSKYRGGILITYNDGQTEWRGRR